MGLSAAQLATLKTDLAANANTVLINGSPVAISAVPHGGQNAQTVADWYNLTAVPDYFVWDSAVNIVQTILNNLVFTNYTPNDSPAQADTLAAMTFNNRAQEVMIKQQNLAFLFYGRTTFDATRTNLRAGLNDATTSLLTGTNGASRSGGWSAILPGLSRKATNGEKLFAFDDGAGIGNVTTDPRGANTNPDSPAVEGQLTGADILNAWA